MRRNLIIIACIFLGILALMVSGNIIIIGEKIASVTHLWWLEWVFYALLLGIFSYYILLPIWRVHHCPAFPALAVDEEASEEQLRDYGKRLTEHCDFIEDAQRRKEHQKALETNLLHASGSRSQLLEVLKQEMALRYDGDKAHGILGINGQIKEWAKTVFMISAISQNSRFDTVSVMWLNYKMIESLVLASGFRPNNRQMFKIYRDILTTALITYAMSETLTKTGAIAPFDFGDLHDSGADAVSDAADVDAMEGATAGIDPDDVGFDEQLTNSEGLSVYSILRRIKIPGVVVGSALDGTVNALMTLRIGYITRTYLQQGEQALTGIKNKRAVKWQAMKDALVTIPVIVASGSSVVGKKTSNLIIKLIKKKDTAKA
ncbi:MAG: hypothetical protein IKH88_08465 [Prevotella sp.]|nr:hypothetical protein [Prevotella sp.]